MIYRKIHLFSFFCFLSGCNSEDNTSLVEENFNGFYCDTYIENHEISKFFKIINISIEKNNYTDLHKVFAFPFIFRKNNQDLMLSYEEFKSNPKRYLPIKDLKKIRGILAEKVKNGTFGGSWRGCSLSRGKVWFHGIPSDNENQFRITAFKIDEEWAD